MISRLEETVQEVFDPKIHLACEPPTKKFTLEDLNLQPSPTSTKIAATLPFPILSLEGVRAYRRALFSQEVLHHCGGSPAPGTLTLRNAASYSTFIRDFWSHPDTMQLLSDAADVPLKIVMSTEIGHTNIQTKGGSVSEMVSQLNVEPQTTKVPLTEEDRAYNPLKGSSIIPWQTGDGVPLKVEGPKLGWGVVLQGGEVEHLAARSMGVMERISTITSFCADVPGKYDSSYITNLRWYSDRPTLYKQWTEYRLEKMKREIEHLQEHIALSPTLSDVTQVQKFAQDQLSYLKRTARQLIPFEDCESIAEKYGSARSAFNLWEKAQTLDGFEEHVATVTPRTWQQGCDLWTDLIETQLAIQAGKTIESQRGRFKWSKERQFCMGDELLRQGLPEILLSWLDATGMYALVTS